MEASRARCAHSQIIAHPVYTCQLPVGGVTKDIMAARLEVTERTVTRRDDRIMEKMVERLGGEPPWTR